MPIPGLNDGLTLHGYQKPTCEDQPRVRRHQRLRRGLGRPSRPWRPPVRPDHRRQVPNLFVVPNWCCRMAQEAARAYGARTMLFVGLRVGKDGKATSAPPTRPDLTAVMEERLSKGVHDDGSLREHPFARRKHRCLRAFMRKADAITPRAWTRRGRTGKSNRPACCPAVQQRAARRTGGMGVEASLSTRHVSRSPPRRGFQGRQVPDPVAGIRRGIDARPRLVHPGQVRLKTADGATATRSPIAAGIYAMLRWQSAMTVE